MSNKIEHRKVVEGVKVEEVFGIQDGEAFVVDETIGAQYVKAQFVGMRTVFAVPFLADDGGITICVEQKAPVGGRQHEPEDVSSDLSRQPQ